MNESRLDVVQLKKRDPAAWTMLLSSQPGLEAVVVTAVTAQPLRYHASATSYSRRVTRYVVSLAQHSDPVSFIGKQTSWREACFYRDLASHLPFLAPRCWFAHVVDEDSWVILDDVPNHYRRDHWTHNDVEDVIGDMVALHAIYWQQEELSETFTWLPHFIGRDQRTFSLDELREDHSVFFEEGPAAVLSEHALGHVGRLAPRLLEAANGLVVMRDLGGWPGVLGETHLTALADLLDDPVPMLQPLINLPVTLLHGDPHPYHWHLTLFDERRLLDWRHVSIGPGLCDLVSFQEQFDLLYAYNGVRQVRVRQASPSTEETIVDSYMLAMKAELGKRFDARQMRLALPAARCLHTILRWLPHFAAWFDQMPNRYTWQRVNRMSDAELQGTSFQPLIGYRPFLRAVFRRFLQAYRML